MLSYGRNDKLGSGTNNISPRDLIYTLSVFDCELCFILISIKKCRMYFTVDVVFT